MKRKKKLLYPPAVTVLLYFFVHLFSFFNIDFDYIIIIDFSGILAVLREKVDTSIKRKYKSMS